MFTTTSTGSGPLPDLSRFTQLLGGESEARLFYEEMAAAGIEITPVSSGFQIAVNGKTFIVDRGEDDFPCFIWRERQTAETPVP